MDDKVEPLKAARPIIITLLGSSTDFKLRYDSNAQFPIDVTPFSMTT